MKIQAVAAVLTGFSLLTSCGLNDAAAEQSAVQQNYAAGSSAHSLPDLCSFTASTLDGGSFTASDFAGADVTVINIWQTSCAPCIREMPEIAEFAAGLPDSIRVMTWCLDADYSPDGEKLSSFMDECGFEGITLTSGDGDMEKLLNKLQYTPTTIFLDSAGHQLCEPLIGAGDAETNYKSEINAALVLLGKDPL
ncbi:MAG: TlpA family protein disulfide reductase [Oscillospiraceae bacterium]|nr:TlpA family protein disulfide reductase [Oscillospiraceae bacterium]